MKRFKLVGVELEMDEDNVRDEGWVETPLRDLRPRPIVYYLNTKFPADLEPVIAIDARATGRRRGGGP